MRELHRRVMLMQKSLPSTAYFFLSFYFPFRLFPLDGRESTREPPALPPPQLAALFRALT